MGSLRDGGLIELAGLDVRSGGGELVTWQGRQALRLDGGLALIPGADLENASVQVWIGSDCPAYPGVAFRIADVANYELAYAVPHASGLWDAIQYDPVFHGSNTWQVYHGPGFQKEALVPIGRWFRFDLSFRGSKATVSVDGQAPLVVTPLARSAVPGLLGLWTYRPAYFAAVRVSSCDDLSGMQAVEQPPAENCVLAWFAEGFGVVECEPHGLLNLNRYLPSSLAPARLSRRFALPEEAVVTLEFGHSDSLLLEIDGAQVYDDELKFAGFADRASRGYVEPGMASVSKALPPGEHVLSTTLGMSEGFGWGLALAATGPGLEWLPVELG